MQRLNRSGKRQIISRPLRPLKYAMRPLKAPPVTALIGGLSRQSNSPCRGDLRRRRSTQIYLPESKERGYELMALIGPADLYFAKVFFFLPPWLSFCRNLPTISSARRLIKDLAKQFAAKLTARPYMGSIPAHSHGVRR